MAKYDDLKAALEFIRKGYGKGDSPFRFTASEMGEAIDLSEKKTRDVLESVNVYARFWKGRFPSSGHNFIVGPAEFGRIKDRFK